MLVKGLPSNVTVPSADVSFATASSALSVTISPSSAFWYSSTVTGNPLSLTGEPSASSLDTRNLLPSNSRLMLAHGSTLFIHSAVLNFNEPAAEIKQILNYFFI